MNDSAPARHSRTARSMSASGSTMAAFFASSPSTARRRCERGCCFFRWSATRLEPIRASTSTCPDASMRGTTSSPGAYTVLTTPGGKASRNTSSKGSNNSAPYCGGLSTTQLPISSAGTSVQKVSFSG